MNNPSTRPGRLRSRQILEAGDFQRPGVSNRASATAEDPNVDVTYINPFVESVFTVFETMLNVEPQREPLKISSQNGDDSQITALIGISGTVHGVVALRFPNATALSFASRMLGSEMSVVNDEVVDAVSELVNMVAGSAKAKFNTDPPLELGLPTVVEGTGYKLKYPSKSVWLEVPFTSDAGPFSIEVTYNPN